MAQRCSALMVMVILSRAAAVFGDADVGRRSFLKVDASADFVNADERMSSREKICTFQAFLDDGQRNVVASTENTIFKSNGVLVVQEDSARIMVFMTEGTIFNWWASSCGQQAVVECGFKSAQLVASDGVASKLACAKYHACAPHTEPDLSYMRSMLGGALTKRRGDLGRIASIGLGAGSIPLWLAKAIPNAQVEAVDVSADVIAAAPCFGLPDSPKLRLIHEDGHKYLNAQAEGVFDVIFIDVFVGQDDTIPPGFRTAEFYSMVKTKLAPGGVVALNIALEPELAEIIGSLRQAFSSGSLWIGEAPGLVNRVVLARSPNSSEDAHVGSIGLDAEGLKVAQTWAAEANFVRQGPQA